MKNLIQAAVVTMLTASTAHAQQAVQWRVQDGGNGHWYRGIASPMTRSQATGLAAEQGGHLATITAAAENQFLADLSLPSQGGAISYWTGGIRTSAGSGPWNWITGEAWSYSNFDTSEPNGCCGADVRFTTFRTYEGHEGRWDDTSPENVQFVLIEWSTDCNSDGIVDYGQVLAGQLSDLDANGTPDCCEQGTNCVLDPIGSGLDGFYPFDASANDASGVGRDATLFDITFADDRRGKPQSSVSFDGAGSWARVDDLPVPTDNNFSWALWLKVDDVPSMRPIIERVRDVGSPEISPCLYAMPGGVLRFYSWNQGPWILESASGSVLPGKWVHVVVTSSQTGRRRIYIDGVPVAERSDAPPYGDSLGVMLLGRDSGDWIPRFRGQLDDLRIYPRELSIQEVERLHRLGEAPPTCRNADIYRDFNVNGADLGILLSQWGPNTPLTESDLNSDGVVNGADLGILLSFWGACP